MTIESSSHLKSRSSQQDSDHETSDLCPFINDTLINLSSYDKFKLAVASVTIAPIRCVFLGISLLLLWPFAMIATSFRAKEQLHLPLDGWRVLLKPVIRFISRAVFFFGGFHWISIHGKEDKDVKVLALAPHSSYMDVLGIVYMNFPSVIGRAGAEDVPLFGYLTKLTQPLIVDRDNPNSRTTVVKKIIDRVNSPLKWPKLAIFTEGTCTNRQALLEFKPGAFLPGLPVQPVCFVYKTGKIDQISWSWKGPSAYMVFWLSICQLHNTFEIHYLPVYYPNEEEQKNVELFANNVRLKMAQYLKVPLSDYSFEDCRLMTKFEKHKLPWILGQIKVNQIKKKYGVNMDALFELVILYAKLADLGTGLVNIHTFDSFMKLKSNDNLIKFFKLFDKNNDGFFDYKSFVETYFEVIDKDGYLKSNETSNELENLIREFGFNNDDENNRSNHKHKLSYDQFNEKMRSVTSNEFIRFDLIDHSNTTKISEEKFHKFLIHSPLHLYYFLKFNKK